MAQRRMLMLYLRYLSSLNENPLLTKSGTCGALGLLEEFSSQALTFENGRNFVWSKMLKMGAYGALINAPLSHFLYDLLGQVVARVPRFQSLVQLALSNLVVLPVQTYVYLASMGLLVNDLSWSETREVIKTNFLPIMITSLKYFPIIQILVFRFVPAPLWVPFFNLLALAFGIYINVTAKSNAKK